MSTTHMLGSVNTAVLPLISATASFSVAIFEMIVFTGLVKAAQIDRRAAARSISAWWKSTYFQGLSLILTLGVTSFSTGMVAVNSYQAGSWERFIAVAGTTFAVGHFAFAPLVVPTIDAMVEVYDKDTGAGADEKSLELQRKWNDLHFVRSLVADLPAVLCFAWLALCH